jgi:hypothetical protein
MPNSTSKIAKEINDQYFTPIETAEWCFQQAADLGWDLTGLAYEPCLGAASFVDASLNLDLDLRWITNDPFPQPDEEPTFQEDARKVFLPHRPDFIFTNPPFGQSNCLARGILAHCLNECDRVAMVLPKGARRMGFIDAQPQHAHLILDVNLPQEHFFLPTGETRTVSTCFQMWERKDTPRGKIRDTLDLREDLITHWCSSKPNFADCDFQVCRWGVMNKIRDELKQSGSWQSVKVGAGFTLDQVKNVVSQVDVSDYLEKGTSVPAFDPLVWRHRVNTEAVKQGLLPAI